jgi:hypothetical protein
MNLAPNEVRQAAKTKCPWVWPRHWRLKWRCEHCRGHTCQSSVRVEGQRGNAESTGVRTVLSATCHLMQLGDRLKAPNLSLWSQSDLFMVPPIIGNDPMRSKYLKMAMWWNGHNLAHVLQIQVSRDSCKSRCIIKHCWVRTRSNIAPKDSNFGNQKERQDHDI